MATSWSIKTIRITIALGQGTFGGAGNSVVIEELPVTVEVTKPGLPEKNSATVSIVGLSLEKMEQLTFLAFQPLQSLKNAILIEAGELDEQGRARKLDTVFKGEITSAFADFSTAPDVTFKIEAQTGGYAAQMGKSPVSVDGEEQASVLIEQFAKEAEMTVRNNGVTASVRNAVFNGSPIEKARAVAEEVGVELIIDDNVMVIQEYDKTVGASIPLSDKNGMIGYPGFTSDGISLRCFYDPNLVQGGQIRVESIVPRATGSWKITKLTHSLSAYSTGAGAWESRIEAAYLGGRKNG